MDVADACSGINYLMSSVAVGYLYAGTAIGPGFIGSDFSSPPQCCHSR